MTIYQFYYEKKLKEFTSNEHLLMGKKPHSPQPIIKNLSSVVSSGLVRRVKRFRKNLLIYYN